MNNHLFDKYKNSIYGFKEFNKLVLNMPRHEFRSMNIEFVKSLAEILREVQKYYSYDDKLTIVKLYTYFHKYLTVHPEARHNVEPFIISLFNFSCIGTEEVEKYYKDNDGQARNFRHLVEIMRLWGLIDDDKELSNRINSKVCDEFCSLRLDEIDGLRSRMISMDIEDNSFFISLKNISSKISDGTIFSYKPASVILRYIKQINRPVSKFEIANLLAIIPQDCKNGDDLFDNAIEIGKSLPANIREHQGWFFGYMGWHDSLGHDFIYGSSQAPTFKFNSFIIFMKSLGLLSENDDESLELTAYSQEILNDIIPPEIAELDRYIKIAEESYSDKDLAALIISNVKPSLLRYASQNDDFIKAMNRRSLSHPIYIKGKKVRSRLIAELSKVRANYTCQVGGTPTFRDNKGNVYVEAHHIIEFNGEDGPDIVENLLVINPYYHDLIHHACKEDLYDFYDTLRKRNIITLDTFKNMIDTYGCLEPKHIQSLYNKHLITQVERQSLILYIKESTRVS